MYLRYNLIVVPSNEISWYSCITCCRVGFIKKVTYFIMCSVSGTTGWVLSGNGLFIVVVYLYMLARAITE